MSIQQGKDYYVKLSIYSNLSYVNKLHISQDNHKCQSQHGKDCYVQSNYIQHTYYTQYTLYNILLCRTSRNKYIHSINGNIYTINIVTWNKDKKNLSNAINRVKNIIIETKADILLVNEANMSTNVDEMLININGFNIEFDKLYVNNNMARSVMYISDKLVYTRMKKYENDIDSSICIKVGYPNKDFTYMEYINSGLFLEI